MAKGFSIVRYIGRDDVGTILREGLTQAQALQAAADLNASACAGTVYCIERW